MFDSPKAKAYVALAVTLAGLIAQTVITEVELSPTWESWLRVVAGVATVLGGTYGVYKVPNRPA